MPSGSLPVGVVLAAGLATRMGRPKQLLPYGDSTVLGSVITAIMKSRLERTIVVVGAYGDQVAATLDEAAVEVVRNPQPERGNLSSLLVATAETGDAPVLLMMGDMPGLVGRTIDAHLEAWHHRPVRLRITEYVDGWGHPMMLSPEVVAELPGLEEPKALWRLVESEGAEALTVPGPMPIDIDTPTDYDEAVARMPSMAGEIEVADFVDQYDLVAPLYGLTPSDLHRRDERASSPRRRWVACRGPECVGAATSILRPDGRMQISYVGSDPAAYGPLTVAAAEALERPLYTTADEADEDRVRALIGAGFTIELTSERFRVRFADALAKLRRAPVPSSFSIVGADEVDEEHLFQLDNELRQDVPGTDGWLGNRDWFHAELTDGSEFDPTAYLVAIHEPTGDFAGLVRLWRNASGPNLGLIGVVRQHRNTTIAAALLKQALAAAASWGHDSFSTHTALTNGVIYPRMARLGAESDGRFHQLVRR